MGPESGRKGRAMPIKGWTVRWLSRQHFLSIALPVFPLSSQQLSTPMAVPLVGHQFDRSDAILGRKILPMSATFVIPSGARISREDKRQHGVSSIGWGMRTYPDNNKVFPL